MISDKKNRYTNFENIFPSLMETMEDLIIITSTDISFKIEYVHECKFLEQLGYTDGFLIGKSLLNLVDFGDNTQQNDLLGTIQQNKDKYDVKVLHKNGKFTWVDLKSTLFNYQKNQQKLIIKLRDISKIKELEIKLEETENYIKKISKLEDSEKKYRDNVELLPDVIFETDLNLTLTYVNSIAFDKFGYTKEDLRAGLKITQIVDPESLEEASKNIKLLLKGRDTLPHKYLLVKKDGNKFYAMIHSKPILKNEEIIGIRGTITDINNLVIAEKELKESEEKFRRIFESIPDIFFLLSEDSTILDYGGKEEDLYIPPEEFIGKRMCEILPPKIGLLAKEYVEKTLETKEPHNLEYSLPMKNGIHFYEGRFFYFSKNTIAVFIRDITKRKQTEEKIKESEDKFRTIAEQSLMGICIIQDFEIKYLNQQIAEIYGYPIDEVKRWKPKEFLKVIHPDSKEMVMKQLIRKQQGSEDIITHYIAKIIKKNGTIRYVENYSKPIRYQGETADLLTQIDITAKMNAEQKLRSSDEKYRHLYENSPNAILLFNMKGEILDCNLISEDVSGFKRDDLIGKNFQNINLIPQTFLPSVLDDFKALLKGKALEPREIQLYTKEGALLWVSYQVSILDYENEKMAQVIIQVIDEKKKAEQKLKESEEKYYKLFETSPDGVILTDLKGNIIECNSAIEHISGYSPKEFIGKNFIKLDIYYENGLEKILEGYKDLLEDNQSEAVEFPIKRKDNQINWVEIRSTLIDMKGQSYVLTVIHDITTQKQAKEAIKESEERYRDLLESSSVGVIELDVINNQIIYMNPKLVEIIGYTGDELTEDHFLNKLIHPKDLRKLLDSNEESELEFRIYDKSGKLKWLAGKRIPHFDENGQSISIRVWLEDITEKKMYENLIYELNVNFLNFTADIRNNIQLLLNTCLNLLNGDFILYINKTEHEGKDTYQILTSDNKSFMCDAEFFADDLFVSALFYESHDFPQTFFDINKMSFANTDPFIARYNLKGCFGKLIKSQNDLESAVCVFYKQNPAISNQDKLVMFLICDAIEIEQRRWQVQRGLEEQNITLNKIDKLKTELFSRTSHELKTPLISIKGFTELLLTIHKPKLDNDIISILEEIKDGSKRLEKIINLLLESTKLEAGQLELNLCKEDLNFLINFCVKELKGLAKLRNQSINLTLHDTLETEFDKERIYEVISNLLVNAIKYTPSGGHIDIESEIRDGFFLISVKDNGIGFTSEEKNQTFKQFGKIERYGQGWDVAIEGTGLGLYITKKLVELHGGKIWVESEGRNKGSSFYFTIPIKN